MRISQELIEIIKSNNVLELNKLLEQKKYMQEIERNIKYNKNTALLTACKYSSKEIISRLLEIECIKKKCWVRRL